ncbi:MAG: hypothetical protein A3K19_20135 [Lentisphaerae bacterium RIFOXYB12_FULL_65_16]|nr:MAG: hypothetical protein A3K18_11215 [Lentisphaerae bacterium RIFOXYA12_64_32]OGV91772.1 MAG: hypothetical protein A3K19_20135 [Lentisphaerae bacterium RIFOXYB12_FULL_65_16]
MRRLLKDIAEIQLGYQARTSLRPQPNGSHVIVQIRDIGIDGVLRFDDAVRVVPERDPGRYELRGDDVLFIARGSRLGAALVPEPPEPTLACSLLYIVRPDPAVVLPAFLCWALNQPPVQAQVRRQAGGTGILQIHRRAVETLEVDVPSTEVQHRICALVALQQRERQLCEAIRARRAMLVEAVCARAARGE